MSKTVGSDEAGYSIVEVLVAILILTIAILPMFKMFDVGLGTTTKSRNYDLAQSLAEKQAELVQANSYSDVKDKFPDNAYYAGGITGCGATSGTMGSSTGLTVSGCRDTDPAYGNFTFSVNKRYLTPLTVGGELAYSATDQKILQVTIAVTRNGEGTPLFTTSGVIAE